MHSKFPSRSNAHMSSNFPLDSSTISRSFFTDTAQKKVGKVGTEKLEKCLINSFVVSPKRQKYLVAG